MFRKDNNMKKKIKHIWLVCLNEYSTPGNFSYYAFFTKKEAQRLYRGYVGKLIKVAIS